MPRKKRSRKKKASQLSDQQLLADSKKVLRRTERVLKAELKEVKRYIKALDGHNSFNVPFSGKC
jgi:hypothetical protein